jgi:hypothetical protein
MTKSDAKKKLEANREKLKERLKQYENAEQGLAEELDENGNVIGPRNDIEYRKMLKELEELEKDENE